jgi:uncharacterized protein (TIGR02611 family)
LVAVWQACRVPPDDHSDDRAEGPSWAQRLHRHLHRNRAMSVTTKVAVTAIGSAVLTAGLIMMVTPGPGLVAIVAGLAILATEWDWAERWLRAARRKLEEAKQAAERLDPRVRRRRVLLTAGGCLVLGGGLLTYLAVADWPGWTVSAWDRAQSFLGFLPDLPGM